MSFLSLELDANILQAIKEAGYTEPTPIQAAAIPVAMSGQDLVGIAQTGTGKTAAFTLPILHQLARLITEEGSLSGTRALILAPTRELVVQIEENIRAYAKHLPISVAAIFGGVSERPQIAALRQGVAIIVATPGRLLDLIKQQQGDFRALNVLVLDEADRMLDMGFLPDIKTIIKELPRKRQTLMFSASLSKEVEVLTKEFQHKPNVVQIGKRANPADTVSQSVYEVPKHLKRALLLHLIIQPGFKTVLVFLKMKFDADRLANYLKEYGVKTATLHSNRSQNQRIRALKDFKTGLVQVLVATDIAARGIDVDGISHVVNFDFPMQPEDYVHRIGRTGRAQAIGIAISFVTRYDKKLVDNLERFIGKSLVRKRAHGFNYDITLSEVTDNESEPRQGHRKHRKQSVSRAVTSNIRRGDTSYTPAGRAYKKKLEGELEIPNGVRENRPRSLNIRSHPDSTPLKNTFKRSATKKSITVQGDAKHRSAKKTKVPKGYWSTAPHNKGSSDRSKKRKSTKRPS